eukprot:8357006-Karenia_brevis.AAC.1
MQVCTSSLSALSFTQSSCFLSRLGVLLVEWPLPVSPVSGLCHVRYEPLGDLGASTGDDPGDERA